MGSIESGPGWKLVAAPTAPAMEIARTVAAATDARPRRMRMGSSLARSAWQAPGMPPHEVVLVRHGETEWARLGRHTGRTDIPLTEDGRAQAELAGRRLAGREFALILTSPLYARGGDVPARRVRRAVRDGR